MSNNKQTLQKPLFVYGTETWKDIPGYEGLYQISSDGNARSLRFGKIKKLKACTTHEGYKEVSLTNKDGITSKYYVHRLVATAFIRNDAPDAKIYVNHINHVRDCNYAENLEWVTPAENVDIIARQRMSEVRTGKPNYHLRKQVICLDDGTVYQSISDCALAYNINQSCISMNLTGKSMTCNGLHFEYA